MGQQASSSFASEESGAEACDGKREDGEHAWCNVGSRECVSSGMSTLVTSRHDHSMGLDPCQYDLTHD